MERWPSCPCECRQALLNCTEQHSACTLIVFMGCPVVCGLTVLTRSIQHPLSCVATPLNGTCMMPFGRLLPQLSIRSLMGMCRLCRFAGGLLLLDTLEFHLPPAVHRCACSLTCIQVLVSISCHPTSRAVTRNCQTHTKLCSTADGALLTRAYLCVTENLDVSLSQGRDIHDHTTC